MLDRSNERDGDGREARWRLISRLVDSRETKERLGPEVDVQMRHFVADGSDFVPTQSHDALQR